MENKNQQSHDRCPHCGRSLSPWEQVLLSVDRALMCKGCWYRINLDAFDHPFTQENGSPESEDKL